MPCEDEPGYVWRATLFSECDPGDEEVDIRSEDDEEEEEDGGAQHLVTNIEDLFPVNQRAPPSATRGTVTSLLYELIRAFARIRRLPPYTDRYMLWANLTLHAPCGYVFGEYLMMDMEDTLWVVWENRAQVFRKPEDGRDDAPAAPPFGGTSVFAITPSDYALWLVRQPI